MAKKDLNLLAKFITEQATNEDNEKPAKNEAAVALGRLGGLKGGVARAATLSAERRKEIAQKAAEKRWGKKIDFWNKKSIFMLLKPIIHIWKTY